MIKTLKKSLKLYEIPKINTFSPIISNLKSFGSDNLHVWSNIAPTDSLDTRFFPRF